MQGKYKYTSLLSQNSCQSATKELHEDMVHQHTSSSQIYHKIAIDVVLNVIWTLIDVMEVIYSVRSRGFLS
jgi:hypothetical protein